MHKMGWMALAVVPFSLSQFALAATQNEVSFSTLDIANMDDAGFLVNYRHYFDAIDDSKGARLINPYLQRISSVSAGYHNSDNVDAYLAGGTWYIDDKWMLSGNYSYADHVNRYDLNDAPFVNEYSTNDARVVVGYNIDANWLVTGGISRHEYNHDDFSLTFNDGVVVDYDGYSDVAYARTVGVRYTNIINGQGWDLGANYLDGPNSDAFGVSARYFFNPALSVSASYDDDDNASVGVDYWFNENFHVSTEILANFDGDSDYHAGSVLASYRF